MQIKARLGFLFLSVLCLSNVHRVEAGTDQQYEPLVGELSQAIKLYRDQDKPVVGYDVVFRRDPMRALIDEEGRLASPTGLYNGLVLQGIIQSKDLRMALINDEFFKPGDTISSYKILEIRDDGLMAQLGDKALFVPLYPELKNKENYSIDLQVAKDIPPSPSQ